VPDLTGRTIQEASLMLSEENLSVGNVGYDPTSDQPEGQIIRQEPAVDTRLSEFEAVDIWISGNETQQIEMPSFVGKNTDTVIKMLNSSGFEKVWIRLVQPKEGEIEETVQQQSPAANMSAGKNTLVELWINRSNPGNYCSDIAVNLDIPDKERSVAVTAVMGNGVEIVLYEGRVKEGTQQAVAFTASMRYGGEYECVAYVDGVEVKRIEAKFTLR
ncbi:MAG: PASTA domain-containing protein, partial [Eubacteriales bacterium]|nr:PASTA domain-containing protein [Eubacteriales bacterium]